MSLGLQMGVSGGGGAGTLYGCWLDGVDDKLSASPDFSTWTSSTVECVIQTTDTSGIVVAGTGAGYLFAFTNVTTTASPIHGGSGSPTFLVDGVAFSGNRGQLYDLIADGERHTLTANNCDLSAWAVWNVGYFGVASVFNYSGVIRDMTVTQSSSLVGRWDITGNLSPDMLDLEGSNNLTPTGSPSRAISTDGGTTWAEEV